MKQLDIVVSLTFTLVALLPRVTAQNITASTCINPSQFGACFQQAQQAELKCSSNANGDQLRLIQCGCDLDIAEIACALENCWNVVYGCEYQSLALIWESVCLGQPGDIPFFPAPETAPGGCSCNLGHILGNYTNVVKFSQNCIANTGKPGACNCCLAGGELTALYDVCPQTDVAALGLGTLEKLLATQDSDPTICQPYFNQYNCINDLGYPPIGPYTYETAIPSSTGTLQPSTTGGVLTAPPSGRSTYVLTAGGVTTTITFAQQNNAQTSSSSSPSRSSSGAVSVKNTSGVAGFVCLIMVSLIMVHL